MDGFPLAFFQNFGTVEKVGVTDFTLSTLGILAKGVFICGPISGKKEL